MKAEIRKNEMSINWHPGMGDYKKVNSQQDAKRIREKIFKTKSLITLLIAAEVLILIGALLYFSV